MIYKQIVFLLAAATAASAKECLDYSSESSCMTGTENGESCSWCTSAAVGNSCNTESDAKSLPSSVFMCEYNEALKVKGSSCNDIKSESTCMSSTENGESCSWCASSAVSSACYIESDSKSLPSSVFMCEYSTKSFIQIGAGYLQKAADFFISLAGQQ